MTKIYTKPHIYLFWIETLYVPLMNLPPHKNRYIIVAIAL